MKIEWKWAFWVEKKQKNYFILHIYIDKRGFSPSHSPSQYFNLRF
jgi:hypothetical protein